MTSDWMTLKKRNLQIVFEVSNSIRVNTADYFFFISANKDKKNRCL